MKNYVATKITIAMLGACMLAALAVPSAFADNFFSSFLGSMTGGVGGGGTKSGDNAPNKNDSVEGMQERRYSYLETAEGAGARASTQPSFGFNGSDIRDDRGTAQSGMIMGAQLNGMLYSEVPLTPLATINFPVASKAQENEMYTHCPPLTGYHLTDSADYINTAISNDVLLGKLSDPERWVNVAKVTQQAQNTQSGNMMAELARNQANSAIDFCSTYLTNFTTSKRWNDVRDKLFIPIAILLLLPGAVLAQVKAIVAAGNPVLEETNPFDGLLRSIVAIFLIPASCLVLNYGIDLSNSLTYTIKSEYQNIFHDDMYQSAICAEVRAFPVRQEAENRGALDMPTTTMGQLLKQNDTVFARVEGQLFENKLEDPCAGIYIAPKERADEALPTKVVAARLAFNTMNAVLCAGLNALCAFQVVYLYYLWLMGPIVAALWVWPMKFLRDALPSWIEGCITLCFWSLLWNTTVLLMACFRGYDETGTFVMTALNTLATICVKYSFDFVQMVMAAGSQANAVGEKLGEAMKANSGSGGGSRSTSGGGGGHHTDSGAGGAGPATRPSALNSAQVLGGGGGHGAGTGAGVGGGGLAGALGAGHGGGSGGAGGAGGGAGGGELSAPLSLLAGHGGGSSGGVGGGLGAISHGGIPSSHGGTLSMVGNIAHGAPSISGINGAGAAGHAMPPSAQLDVLNTGLNSAIHNVTNSMGGDVTHLPGMTGADITHLGSNILGGDVTNLASSMPGGDVLNLNSLGGGAGMSSVLNGGDITNLGGGPGAALGSVFNGGDVSHLESTIGAASLLHGSSSTFNGGDVMHSANIMNPGNLIHGGDAIGKINNLAGMVEGDSPLNTALSAAGDTSNINSALNIAAGTTLNGGDINLPPLSGADIDNNIANLLGDDVSNVANSLVDGADISNVSSNMNSAISGDVNVGGGTFSATMNGGDINNSNSVSTTAAGGSAQNAASFVNNGGDVSSSVMNASSLTNNLAASMINNLDVSNSTNAASNFANMVDQGVDISSTMAQSMDMTNVSATNSSMNTDLSSSMVNNVDVNSIGPSSLNASSTTYDVDHNTAQNVDVNNSSSSTYAPGGDTQYSTGGSTQYTSGGTQYTSGSTQYSSGGSTQYASGGSSGAQYNESRSGNNAANVGASMQNAVANSLGGGTTQGSSGTMQQLYQNFDGDTNIGANSISTSSASFDTSSSYSTSTASVDSSSTYTSSGPSADSSTSYSSSTSYGEGAPPQTSYSGAQTTSATSSSGGDSYSQSQSSSSANSSSGSTYASGTNNAGYATPSNAAGYASGSNDTANASASTAPVNVVQALAPTQQGAASQVNYGDSSTGDNAPVSLNFNDSNSSSSQSQSSGPDQANYSSADATSNTAPAASNYTYVADSSAANAVPSSTSSSGSSSTYYVDNSSSVDSGSSGNGAADYARYAMSDHGSISQSSAACSPVQSGEHAAPPMIIIPTQAFNRQAASLQDVVKQGLNKDKPENQAKPETNGKPQSKLGNALRGAGCPLPPGDKSAMPPSTKKPAQTNPQFATGAPGQSAAPPPVSRADAMDIASGNTRNRYRKTSKMTEEELRELEESASGWMV